MPLTLHPMQEHQRHLGRSEIVSVTQRTIVKFFCCCNPNPLQSYDIKGVVSSFVPKNNIFGTGVPIPLKMAGVFRMRWCLCGQSMDVFAGNIRVSLRATCAGLCGGLRVWVYGQANIGVLAISPFLMKGALHCKR